DIDSLDVMFGQMKPADMLQNMGLACAMGVPMERVFSDDPRDRHTILDAPAWAIDGRQRHAFNREHGLSRAVLYPTFMLAGGTFAPSLAPAVCAVYNDWICDDYCAGSGGALIPVAALPIVDPEASVAEVRRVAAKGFKAAFIRTNPANGVKYSSPAFDPLWREMVETRLKARLHPPPLWDPDGPPPGVKPRDHHAPTRPSLPAARRRD